MKGATGNVARVLEGPVPRWKLYESPQAANGGEHRTWGLPRFREASFEVLFPFGTVRLQDDKLPLKVELTGWSPFEPGDADSSSLPVAALEYTFTNRTGQPVDAVFSFHARNFMAIGKEGSRVRPAPGGFVLAQAGSAATPQDEGAFAAVVTIPATAIAWFRGTWLTGPGMAERGGRPRRPRRAVAGGVLLRPPLPRRNAPPLLWPGSGRSERRTLRRTIHT